MNMRRGLIIAVVVLYFVMICILIGVSESVAVPLAVIIMFIAVISSYSRDKKKEQQKKAAEMAAKRFDDFYKECQKYGIDDLNNPGSAEKNQRLELIAKKYGYSLTDSTVLQRFDDYHKEKMRQEAAKKEQEIEAEKRKEQGQYAELAYYAKLHGTDKPVAMFTNLAMSETSGGVSYIPMKKESDGAIMAGIASGIGGTVPALMSLSRTARNNDIIRQQNQAAQSINSALFEADMRARSSAAKYQEKAGELAIKLVSDMPSAKVFQYLQFENIQTKVSQLGTVTIEAEASVEGTVTVFDKPGFVDGHVMAEIYDGNKKIGETAMVFPAYGSINFEMNDRGYLRTNPGKPVKLEGICLNCGEQGKEYTVKLRPGDLWIMEK